jgi:ATP-dependent 26S proteasome regulatory subunit
MPVFSQYICAGHPLLWIETHEENRAIGAFIKEMSASKEKYNFYAWDRVEGISTAKLTGDGLTFAKVQSEVSLSELKEAFDWFTKAKDNSILFFKDFHHYVEKDMVTRTIRNLTQGTGSTVAFKSCHKAIVCISPLVKVPLEIEKEIVVIPFKLPVREDLRVILKTVCESATDPAEGREVKYPEDDSLIIDSALGMTSYEAENAFSVSLIGSKGKFNTKTIQGEKAAIVRKGGVLEIIEQTKNLEDIGGNENLKACILERAGCFTEESRRFGIRPPKGILMVGPPGTGKTLGANAIAAALTRPLLKFDLSRVYGQYVGESEGNLRRAFTQAEGVAPCVLMIDEVDKAVGGADDSGSHEVSKRVLGNLLTWMSDKTADIYVVATANNCSSIPDAMLRPGRFDKIFFVDFPGKTGRKEIFSIHLKKIGRKPSDFDLSILAEATEGFTGAEIEVLLQEALVKAFSVKSELKVEHIVAAVPLITPVRKIMGDKVNQAREWADMHGALFASTPEKAGPVSTSKRKITN